MLWCRFTLKSQDRWYAAIAVKWFSFFENGNEFVTRANAVAEPDHFLVPHEISAQGKRTVTSEVHIDDSDVTMIKKHQREAVVAQQPKTFLQCKQSENG